MLKLRKTGQICRRVKRSQVKANCLLWATSKQNKCSGCGSAFYQNSHICWDVNHLYPFLLYHPEQTTANMFNKPICLHMFAQYLRPETLYCQRVLFFPLLSEGFRKIVLKQIQAFGRMMMDFVPTTGGEISIFSLNKLQVDELYITCTVDKLRVAWTLRWHDCKDSQANKHVFRSASTEVAGWKIQFWLKIVTKMQVVILRNLVLVVHIWCCSVIRDETL